MNVECGVRIFIRYSVVVLFFILHSSFFIQPASAQRACTDANEAETCGPLGPQFRCVSNRCNLPPPIWNVAGTGLRVTGQNAQLFLTGTTVDNSAQVGNLQIGLGNQLNNLLAGELAINWSPPGAPRLGRGFTIYNGDDAPWFRVDENGGVSIAQGLNVGAVTGAVAGELRTAGGIIAGTTVRGNFVSTTGASCAANQILKRNAAGTAWECLADGAAWPALTGFPAACGVGQFVTAVDSSGLTCVAPPAGGGATDHGGLTGLADNDHPQYYLQTGDVRDLTVGGRLRIGAGATFPAGAIANSAIVGGDLYSNTLFSRGRGADDIWAGDADDRLQVRGSLVVGGTATANGAAVLTQPVGCGSGQVLKWNGISWECRNDDVGGGGGGGISGSGTAGQVSYFTGATAIGSSVNLVWNAGANRLGIGVETPLSPLDVAGDVRFSGTLQAGTVPWARLTMFPVGCGAGEFVTAVGGTLTCAAPPAPPASGLTGTGVANKLAYFTGASALGQTALLHFDPVTGRMGIGTAAPTERLEIRDDTGTAARLRIADEAQNPEFQLKYGNGASDHWAMYVDQATQELRLWRGDNRLTLTAGGDLRASGCLGAVVVGATAGTVNGNLNGTAAPNDGYRGIDGLCNTAFSGSHQCATGEVLGSIHCGAIWTDATKTVLRPAIAPLIGINAWIANGAPSLPTPTNDCYGWTQTGVIGGQQSQGIIWSFSVQGGGGYARPCNEQNRVLCCQ